MASDKRNACPEYNPSLQNHLIFMKKFDPNYLLTLSKLAVTFHEQGKTDEAVALIYQLIEECYPHILERAKTDRTVIYELIKQKNSKDKRLALEAKNLLEYLKLRGIEI